MWMGFCTFHTLMKTHSGKIEMQIMGICIVKMEQIRKFTSNGLKNTQSSIHMDFNSFLNKKKSDAMKENDLVIIEEAERKDKDLMQRIENYRINKLTDEERSSETTESIRESIITNKMIRSIFRKDPSKQSIHEKAQIEWIQRIYPDTIKLPANTNGKCLSKYNLHTITKSCPRPPDATKTIDFHIPSKNIYGILKFTNESGGAQDNQFRDVKHFIVQIIGYITKNESTIDNFAFYLDGDYYTTSKIKELTDEIPEIMKQRILITSCASIN